MTRTPINNKTIKLLKMVYQVIDDQIPEKLSYTGLCNLFSKLYHMDILTFKQKYHLHQVIYDYRPEGSQQEFGDYFFAPDDWEARQNFIANLIITLQNRLAREKKKK